MTHTTESEDKGPLARVSWKRNASVQRIGIELPPLNTTLVEVHMESASVSIGAKDMAEKNKNQWKMIKLMEQLEKTQHRIPELQSDTQARTERAPTLTSLTPEIQMLREEVES